MSAIAKKVFFLQVVFFVTVGSVSEAQENALGYPALATTTIFDTFEVEKVKEFQLFC